MAKILQINHPRYSFADKMTLPVILDAEDINDSGDAYVKSEDLVAAGCSESCMTFKGWWMPNRSYRTPSEIELKLHSRVTK